MWNTDLPTPFPMWINNGRQMQLSLCQLVAARSLLSSIEKAFQNVKGVGIETHAIVFTYNSCEHPFERHFHMSNYAYSYSLFVCVYILHVLCLHQTCAHEPLVCIWWCWLLQPLGEIQVWLAGLSELLFSIDTYGCGRQYNITELSVLEDNLYTKVLFNVYGVLQH